MTIGHRRFSPEDRAFASAIREIAIQRGGTLVGSGSDIHAALAAHAQGRSLTTCGMHADHLLRDLIDTRGRGASIAVERIGAGAAARWSITPALLAAKHPLSHESLLITPDEVHAFRRAPDGSLVSVV